MLQRGREGMLTGQRVALSRAVPSSKGALPPFYPARVKTIRHLWRRIREKDAAGARPDALAQAYRDLHDAILGFPPGEPLVPYEARLALSGVIERVSRWRA